MVLCRLLRVSSVGSKVLTTLVNAGGAGVQFQPLARSFSLAQTMLSAGRRYTQKHEWVDVNGDVGAVGITNYAQEALGDVVFAELPAAGATVTKGAECGALESVKAASELFSPVTGTVLEKNTEVEETPGLINTSCYDKGWLFKVKLSQPDEVESLMTEDAYNTFLKSH